MGCREDGLPATDGLPLTADAPLQRGEMAKSATSKLAQALLFLAGYRVNRLRSPAEIKLE